MISFVDLPHMQQDSKAIFIRENFLQAIQHVSATTPALWGKMDAQQMAEHVADFFDVAVKRIEFTLVTPAEHLPKYREFLYSDKVFRENTKAPADILGEEPLPHRSDSLADALLRLKESVHAFFQYFEANPQVKTIHPVFGELDFNEWVMLHYKHVTHHLKQFGLLPVE